MKTFEQFIGEESQRGLIGCPKSYNAGIAEGIAEGRRLERERMMKLVTPATASAP